MFFESKELKLERLKAEHSELCKMLYGSTEIPQYYADKRVKLAGKIAALRHELNVQS